MPVLHIFTFIPRNRLLMFSDAFFFCLAQCMFNLYIAKQIPTYKNTVKIAQIFCNFFVLTINIICICSFFLTAKQQDIIFTAGTTLLYISESNKVKRYKTKHL